MLDRQPFTHSSRSFYLDQNSFYQLEPTYKNSSGLINITEQKSLSRTKSISLTSTRSKGLTLSLKKQTILRKKTSYQSDMYNPENVKQSDIIRRKNQSPLVKTSHTIHYLGGSLSKSKDDKNNRSNLYCKKVNLQSSNKTNPHQKIRQSIRMNHVLASKQHLDSFNNKQSLYEVKISSPIISDRFEDSQRTIQTNRSKVGKITCLKNKTFLRSSKNQSPVKNNYQQKNVDKKKNHKQGLLRTSHKQIEIKSKRQFLQSYIEKPMINSIIVSGNIDNLSSQPQSPVLRLKKRLQLNSINCIYQRQTLVSHEIHENTNSSVQIQQSIIVHRNILQNFKPLSHKQNIFIDGQDLPYKLYLGRQIYLNLIFTIKQLPFQYFQKFAEQIRIYQQLTSCRFDTKNVLELIKFSTDSDKHLTIKQPYTQTLHDYLQNFVVKKITKEDFQNVVQSILKIIELNIINMEQNNIFLKRQLTLNDFVFVFTNLKFENMQMFQVKNIHSNLMNNRKQLLITQQNNQKSTKILRQQALKVFQQISSGSLDY